jgi:hypothetical protein
MSGGGQAEIDALEVDLAAFISSALPVRGPGRGADFWALAQRLHAHHLTHNDDWRAMFGDIAPADRWEALPAAPVTLLRDLPLTAFDPAAAAVTFRTSGTTGPRGVVRLRDTRLYDLGARRQAAAVAGPIPRAGSSLVPHGPDSSLGHMCLDLAPGLRPRFTLDGGVDIDGLRVEYPDGFGLARPSNTTPIIVLRFEADNTNALKRIQSDFRKALLAVKAGASLPF